MPAGHRGGDADVDREPSLGLRLWRRLRDDWDAFHVVPVDDRCLARAVDLGAEYSLRTVDAIHLAAAERTAAESAQRHRVAGHGDGISP